MTSLDKLASNMAAFVTYNSPGVREQHDFEDFVATLAARYGLSYDTAMVRYSQHVISRPASWRDIGDPGPKVMAL